MKGSFQNPLHRRAEDLVRRSLSPVPLEMNELDWKLDLSPNSERLEHHISAFANQVGGGFFVLGIRRDGVVQGVDPKKSQAIIDRVTNVARDSLEPSGRVEAWTMQDPLGSEQSILVIHVAEGDMKPVHLRGKGIEFGFCRSGGQTRKMTRDEITRALLSSRSVRFEELSRTDLTGRVHEILDLDVSFSRLGASVPVAPDAVEDTAVDLGLATRTAMGIAPTNLGIVLAAKDFRTIPGMEKVGIRIIRYRGDDRLSPATEVEYRSGVLTAVDQAVASIMEHVPRSESLRSATRIEVPQWTQPAVREALVNAVCHREYSGRNEPVVVELFHDRLETRSPGGLLPGQQVDRLLDRPPKARNEVLADRLRRANLAEERGRGIDLLMNEAEIRGIPAPELVDDAGFFTVVFLGPRRFRELTPDQRLRAAYVHAALAFLAGRRATNSTLRERLGLSNRASDRVAVSRLLGLAVERGLIRPEDPAGAKRSSRYVPSWAANQHRST